MIVENAHLQVKLSSLESQMLCLLDTIKHGVTNISMELTALNDCITDDISDLMVGVHLVDINVNSSFS